MPRNRSHLKYKCFDCGYKCGFRHEWAAHCALTGHRKPWHCQEDLPAHRHCRRRPCDILFPTLWLYHKHCADSHDIPPPDWLTSPTTATTEAAVGPHKRARRREKQAREREKQARLQKASVQEAVGEVEVERQVEAITRTLERARIDDGVAEQPARSIQIRGIVAGGGITAQNADAVRSLRKPPATHHRSTYCARCGVRFKDTDTLSLHEAEYSRLGLSHTPMFDGPVFQSAAARNAARKREMQAIASRELTQVEVAIKANEEERLNLETRMSPTLPKVLPANYHEKKEEFDLARRRKMKEGTWKIRARPGKAKDHAPVKRPTERQQQRKKEARQAKADASR